VRALAHLSLLAGFMLLVSVGNAVAGGTTMQAWKVAVDLRFAATDGTTQTIVASATAETRDAARSICKSNKLLGELAKSVVSRNPNLADKKLLTTICERSSDGDISGTPRVVEKSVFNRRPGFENPAVVVLKYEAPDRTILKAVIGDRKSAVVDVDHCQIYLQKYLKQLIKSVRDSYVGDKFLGATCLPAPENVSTIIDSSN
jgi:hypothetical protein